MRHFYASMKEIFVLIKSTVANLKDFHGATILTDPDSILNRWEKKNTSKDSSTTTPEDLF